MYLKSVTLRDIKCFDELHLDFSRREGDEGDCPVRRWTVLLGENGVGKSTLLQALAIAVAGPGATRELLPVADGWVRHNHHYGELEAILLWSDGDAQLPRWPKKTPYNPKFLVCGPDPAQLPAELAEVDRPTVASIIEWPGRGDSRQRETVTKELSRLKQTAYAENKAGWLACGYGPFRRLSGGSQDADKILYAGRKAARFVTLFREDAALTNATEWLIGLYNTARDGDGTSRRALDVIHRALASGFFLEEARIDLNARQALLKLGDRSAVPFQSLSDGYRSMLALGIDLLRWMIQAFPEADDPLEQPGVVLIDELDAHLHPLWQQRIGNWLLQKFPRLQFVVATHSAFLAQVARAGGNIILRLVDERVVAKADTASVTTWRADQILNELFGLASTRAPEIEKKLRKYFRLTARERQGQLTAQEQDEKRQLDLLFQDLPPPFESAEERALADVLAGALHRRASAIRELE